MLFHIQEHQITVIFNKKIKLSPQLRTLFLVGATEGLACEIECYRELKPTLIREELCRRNCNIFGRIANIILKQLCQTVNDLILRPLSQFNSKVEPQCDISRIKSDSNTRAIHDSDVGELIANGNGKVLSPLGGITNLKCLPHGINGNTISISIRCGTCSHCHHHTHGNNNSCNPNYKLFFHFKPPFFKKAFGLTF